MNEIDFQSPAFNADSIKQKFANRVAALDAQADRTLTAAGNVFLDTSRTASYQMEQATAILDIARAEMQTEADALQADIQAAVDAAHAELARPSIPDADESRRVNDVLNELRASAFGLSETERLTAFDTAIQSGNRTLIRAHLWLGSDGITDAGRLKYLQDLQQQAKAALQDAAQSRAAKLLEVLSGEDDEDAAALRMNARRGLTRVRNARVSRQGVADGNSRDAIVGGRVKL